MNIDRGHVNAAVFLDLKKSFDTVNRDILLAKLHYYGLRGPCHDCLASHLNNRTQICKTNCLTFSPKLVKCGAPQGTIKSRTFTISIMHQVHQSAYFFQNLVCMLTSLVYTMQMET